MILSSLKQVAEMRLKTAGDWPVAQAEEELSAQGALPLSDTPALKPSTLCWMEW